MSVEQGRKGRSQSNEPLGSRGVPIRKPQHEIMAELSESMDKQQRMMTKEMTSMSKQMKEITRGSKSDSIMSERIHDRLESLILEQRTTNILLSRMVAIHESVLIDRDRVLTHSRAENIRMDTYNRVLHGD